MVGEVVVLRAGCYSGALGVVTAALPERKGHARSYEVLLPGFGTVVRAGVDLAPVSTEDVETGRVVPVDPREWLQRLRLRCAKVGLMAAVRAGDDGYAIACAEQVVELEASCAHTS